MAQSDENRGGNRAAHGQNYSSGMPPMPDFVRPLGQMRQGYRSNPFTPPPARPQQYEHPVQNRQENDLAERDSTDEQKGLLSKLSPAGILKMLGLGKTGIDNDIIIIIMIFLMMSGEKSDDLLTLALIYIML